MELETLKSKICNVVSKVENPQWAKCVIVYEFAPFINKGFVSVPTFWDSNDTKLDFYMKYDLELNALLYRFIFESKTLSNSDFNQLIFSTTRNDYENPTIDFSYNQEIEDRFQSNLPRSKKGKTIPWWLIPGEIKDLLN